MKYGKLFKKFVETYGVEPVATRVSELSYKDKKEMAKMMYASGLIDHNYTHDNNTTMTSTVYNALKKLHAGY